jgi:cell wall-associated NlpC family hydrolase
MHEGADTQAVPPARQMIETGTGSSPGQRVAEHALAMLGKPYLFGGARPETGFDCSGLVHYAYLSTGLPVPRTSREQYRASHKIPLEDAREGDLLFFEDEEKLAHVGIYVGAGRFVHAPASGRSVSVASLASPYYRMHLVGVGRLAQAN